MHFVPQVKKANVLQHHRAPLRVSWGWGGFVCPLGVKDWVTSALASFSEAVEKEYQSMCLELSVHLLSIF